MTNITIEEKKGIIIAHLYGVLSIDNIKQVDETLRKELEQKPEIIGINCINLEHIDSIAISHLVKFSNKSVDYNTKVIYYDLNDHLQNLFKIARLDQFLKTLSREEFETTYL